MGSRMLMVGFAGEDLSKPMDQSDALAELRAWVMHRDRDYRIRRRGSVWGRVRPGPETFDRCKEIVPNLTLGETLLIQNVRSARVYAIRIVEVGPHPIPTTGNDRVDLFFGAVVDEFDSKFDIINMGALVNKPGQHGVGNAIDIGVRKPQSASAIHDAIEEIAEWEKRNVGQGLHLPVNGIIVMYKWCERRGDSMSAWFPYHGVGHVSHTHQSFVPNPLPGWI